MMRHLAIIFTVFLFYKNISAQSNLYDNIKMGENSIGIADTILFDSNYSYNHYGYKGKKPYFIKIWYPLLSPSSNDYLKIKELFTLKGNKELKIVQDSLENTYGKNFIRDYLVDNIKVSNENKLGKPLFENTFQLIGNIDTRSVRGFFKEKSNLPVIVYYNGSQGHPCENFLMAEYFASRGYIFVSASFELQFENLPFGMLPYERFHSNEYEESLKTITKFAQSLTNSKNIFFIGHSQGAQMGLRTFGKDSTIKGMVSLETSLEFKSDYDEIKSMWPEVYKKIISEKVNYPFPVLFCAATGEAKPFSFLEKVDSPQKIYLSTISEFDHNAYLTFYYLRFFLPDSIEQSNKVILAKSFSIYVKHLNEMHRFIESILNKKNDLKLESKLITE